MIHKHNGGNPTKSGEGTPSVEKTKQNKTRSEAQKRSFTGEGGERRETGCGGAGGAEQRALTYDVIGTLTSVTSPGRSPISLPGQVLWYSRTV